MAEIAAQARCSIGLVSKVLRNYRDYGQVNDPFRQRTGWPSKLSEADLKQEARRAPEKQILDEDCWSNERPLNEIED